mmetsp:Transcript_32917/g.99460  ORF Transcript_32917/g.99460 Transcript_32917/m.99460 type:complete len:235 (-) Transcript_32917:1837-2541(-)
MKVGSATSQKSSRFACISAPATSQRLKRTDWAEIGVSSLTSRSSPSESSSGAGAPRRRFRPGSVGVSLSQGNLSSICTMTVTMSLTPSLVRTPSPAFRTTPARPADCACSWVLMSSVSVSAFPAAVSIAPTVFFKNSVTSCRRLPVSSRPPATAVRAQPAKYSQVLNSFCRKESGRPRSSIVSKFSHVMGMKSQNSSSKASSSVLRRSRASSISSTTLVFKPKVWRLSSSSRSL